MISTFLLNKNILILFIKKYLIILKQLPELWVRDCYACADPRYQDEYPGD